MFVSNVLTTTPTTPTIGLQLVCVTVFAVAFLTPTPTSVHAITTKASPPSLLSDDTSPHTTNQFVQIRSAATATATATAVNQPTRAFLVQQKNTLSPVQQTHILDDVQKNQRVHYYHQPSGGGDDKMPKALLTGGGGGGSAFSSTSSFQSLNNEDGGGDGGGSGSLTFSPSGHRIAFDASSPPLSKPNDYVDFNSLPAAVEAPPPPLQTVVLSPQQSLPTSPSFVVVGGGGGGGGEYVSPPLSAFSAHHAVAANPAHRQQQDGSASSVSSSSHKIPYPTSSVAASASTPIPITATIGPVPTAVQVGRQASYATRDFFVKKGGGGGSFGSPIRYWPTASATPYSGGTRVRSEFSSYTSPALVAATAPAANQYPKYEPAFALASSAWTATATTTTTTTTTTTPKTYYASETNGNVYSPTLSSPINKSQQQSRPKNRRPNKDVVAVAPSDKFVKEVYLKTNPEILIAKDRQKFFQQLLEDGRNTAYQNDNAAAAGDDDDDDDDDDQTVAQNNFGNMRGQFEKEFLRQLKQSIGADNANVNGGGGGGASAISQVGAFLAAANSSATGVSEFRLPNGQKIQISKDPNRLLRDGDGDGDVGIVDDDNQPSANDKIKAIVVKQLPSSTTGGSGSGSGVSKTNILEELTKGVVPPGAEFEVIKRNKDGALEEVSKLPQNIPQKKVTFVILEEQADGTVKVQGVRGSEKESLKESGEEVDTIIKKIARGELKLPPSTRLSPKQHSSAAAAAAAAAAKKHSNKQRGDNEYETKSKRKPTTVSVGGGDVDQPESQHFVPTPIVQTYAATTPQSLQPDTYATATEDATSYLYHSSAATAVPSKFYNVDVDGDIGKFSSASSATNHKAASTWSSPSNAHAHAEADNDNDSDGVSLYGRWNSAAAVSKIAALDKLGLSHLNSSGYIASLFSALKTHQQPSSAATATDDAASASLPQLPFLPTTLGHRIVQRPDERQRERNSTSGAGGGGGNDDDDDEHAGATATTYGYGYGFETSKTTNADTSKKQKDGIRQKKRDRNAIRKSGGGAAKKPNKETKKDNDEEESNVEEIKSSEDTIAVTATAASASTSASADSASSENFTLSDVLKKEGFYAMARFLRQSGLDSILNDTGPFTLFIPTDKAFRTLLIQLGGPDKAEDKFKENPRLLSGLLLHHVIPGAFRVNSLQDEMTGVSLAGTQLRVNTYTTHDIEWNDITVVTVNGAKILDEKDIVIPQGIAHAIDRVMFPLPVGNLLQSLQADRENRYSNFLKILQESELSYLLTGGKTFTLFAPLNRAFTHSEFTKILADANECKSFVLRHMAPGALYSAGMKYYQVRDSMEDGQQITLYKEAGKIKVNNAHVVTRNIPAANGVIHAIDAFL